MSSPLPLRAASLVCAALAALGVAGEAYADEDDQPFLTLHTTELEEPGGLELENWFFFDSGHAHEAFTGFENKNELEYGIAENWQGSLYLNYGYERDRPHAPPAPAEVATDVSVAGELIWRALDLDDAPLGLAFYLEPEIGSQERSVQGKVLLQKNFFGDRLRAVVNLIAQDSWEHRTQGGWNNESTLEFDAGLAWTVSPAWNVALEFDNERGFDGEIIGTGAKPVSDSYYLGPTVQYAADPVEITFGVQAQLPAASNPSHTPGAVVDGFSADESRWRLILRMTSEL